MQVLRRGFVDTYAVDKQAPALSWDNGSAYWGEVRDGLPHGRGIVFIKGFQKVSDDKFIVGSFDEGEPRRAQFWLWPDGFYEGATQGYAWHGWGRQYRGHAHVPVFEGHFVEGRKHGYGTARYADGTIYDGRYRHGRRNGLGVIRFPCGRREISRFADGTPTRFIKALAGARVGSTAPMAPPPMLGRVAPGVETDPDVCLNSFQRAVVTRRHREARDIVAQWELLPAQTKRSIVRHRDARGMTALHAILLAGDADPKLVRALVVMGSDVNCVDNTGAAPLHYACGLNRPMREVLKILSVNRHVLDYAAPYPLEALEKFAATYKPVYTAMRKSGGAGPSIQVIEELLAAGAQADREVPVCFADADETDTNGRRRTQPTGAMLLFAVTALELAALRGGIEIVMRLMCESSIIRNKEIYYGAGMAALFYQDVDTAHAIFKFSEGLEALNANLHRASLANGPTAAGLERARTAETSMPREQQLALATLRHGGIDARIFGDLGFFATFMRADLNLCVPAIYAHRAVGQSSIIVETDGRLPQDAPETATRTPEFRILGHALVIAAVGLQGFIERASPQQLLEAVTEAAYDAALHTVTELQKLNITANNPYRELFRRIVG